MADIRTIVELDMVGYSNIAAFLNAAGTAEYVGELNGQIRGFIGHALEKIAGTWQENVITTTGDGGIVSLPNPDAANEFATAFFAAARDHNKRQDHFAGRRIFRMGAATGDLAVSTRADGAREYAGMVIAKAVRLEASARPGGLVVDDATYDGLEKTAKTYYDGPEKVPGKHSEVFKVYRRQSDPDAPGQVEDQRRAGPPPPAPPSGPSPPGGSGGDGEPPGDPRKILEMLERYAERKEYPRLRKLLGMQDPPQGEERSDSSEEAAIFNRALASQEALAALQKDLERAMDYPTFLRERYQRELVVCFQEPTPARNTLIAAGFDPYLIPPFNTPADFWRVVCESVANGAPPGRFEFVLEQAAEMFAFNEKFRRFKEWSRRNPGATRIRPD